MEEQSVSSSFLKPSETIIPMVESMGPVPPSKRKKCLLNITTVFGTLIVIAGTALIFVAKEAFWDRAFLEAMAEKIQNKMISPSASSGVGFCSEVNHLSEENFASLNITHLFPTFVQWKQTMCD